MKDIKQILSNEQCLVCQGCCRFREQKSVWSVRLTTDESQRLAQQEIVAQQTADDELFLKTAEHEDLFFCTLFDLTKQKCRVYNERPFECRLYPFLIVKKDKDIYLGVHSLCPFVEDHRESPFFKKHIEYLKEYISDAEVLKVLKQNSHLLVEVADLSEGVELLFEINL